LRRFYGSDIIRCDPCYIIANVTIVLLSVTLVLGCVFTLVMFILFAALLFYLYVVEFVFATYPCWMRYMYALHSMFEEVRRSFLFATYDVENVRK